MIETNRLNNLRNVTSIALAIVLLFPLLKIIPRPATLTGHPWKVELLSAIFLLVCLICSFAISKKIDVINECFQGFYPRALFLSILSFLGWSGFSYFWATSARSVLHHTLLWAVYVIFFVFFLGVIRKAKSHQILLSVFAFLSIIIGLLALFDFLSMVDFSRSEGAIRIRYAVFAEMLLPIVPIFFGLALYRRSKSSRIAIFSIGSLGWLAIMLSLSKGAFLSGIVSFVVLFAGLLLFQRSALRKKTLVLALGVITLTIAVQLFFSFSSAIPSTTEYITGKADSTRSTTHMRVYTWKVTGKMISENLFFGVGADNYGIEFNNARKEYVTENPVDAQNSIAESYMVERSHNELLQIFAELGIIGLLIILFILGIFVFWLISTLISNKFVLSPILIASFSGLAGFLASSLVSSFSFRAAQNGIVFFLVIAIAVNELIKANRTESPSKEKVSFAKNPRFAFAVFTFLLVIGVISFATTGASNIYVHVSENEGEPNLANEYLETALNLNDENMSAYLAKGARSYSNDNCNDAIPQFRKAADNGVGISLLFYYIAQCQIDTGNLAAAELTLKEASELFPNSIYVRIHHGFVLHQQGKLHRAKQEFKAAQALDEKEAKAWKIIFEENMLAATLRARDVKDVAEPNDLKPSNVLLAVLSDEKRKSNPKTAK